MPKLDRDRLDHRDELTPSLRNVMEFAFSAAPSEAEMRKSLARVQSRPPSTVPSRSTDAFGLSRHRKLIAASFLLAILSLASATETWAEVAKGYQTATADLSSADQTPPNDSVAAVQSSVGWIRRFVLMVHVFSLTVGLLGMLLAWSATMVNWIMPPRAQCASRKHWRHRVLRASLVCYGIGVVMGCVWSQATWGRLWGWDPKEAFALFTLGIGLVWYSGAVAHRSGTSGSTPSDASLAETITSCVAFWMISLAFTLGAIYSSNVHSYDTGSVAPTVVTALCVVNLLGIAITHLLRRNSVVVSSL